MGGARCKRTTRETDHRRSHTECWTTEKPRAQLVQTWAAGSTLGLTSCPRWVCQRPGPQGSITDPTPPPHPTPHQENLLPTTHSERPGQEAAAHPELGRRPPSLPHHPASLLPSSRTKHIAQSTQNDKEATQMPDKRLDRHTRCCEPQWGSTDARVHGVEGHTPSTKVMASGGWTLWYHPRWEPRGARWAVGLRAE